MVVESAQKLVATMAVDLATKTVELTEAWKAVCLVVRLALHLVGYLAVNLVLMTAESMGPPKVDLLVD